MAITKHLVDKFGVIFEAQKILPDDKHKIQMLESLAELEDNECHKKRDFPVTRLHKVKGIKQAIYRADIDKMSGWRMHIQYEDGAISLKDVLPGKEHDNVIDVIQSKKHRYSD